MTLGEKIQELRRRNAMSQDALAEKLEVSRQAVSKWERDEAMPETDKIVRLAQVFGVSTDYLLLNEQPLPHYTPQPEPQVRPSRHTGARVERFIRRHGYKAGYALIAWGAVLCVIALLVMVLLPGFGSGMFDASKSDSDLWNSGIDIEGDVPPEVLDQIYDQAGAGMGGDVFGDMEDEYNQQVDQMNKAWSGSLLTMAALFGIPVLLVGIILITFGTIIVVKGKKIAAQVQ